MGSLSPASIERLQARARRFPAAFPRGFTPEAAEVHASSIVVDLHSDPMLQWCFFRRDFVDQGDPSFDQIVRTPAYGLVRAFAGSGRHKPLVDHADIPRMRLGGFDAAVFGLHWYPPAVPAVLKPWSGISRQLSHLADLDAAGNLTQIRSPEALRACAARGVFAAAAGIEGWHCLGRDSEPRDRRLDRLAQAKDRGALYLTINHHTDNDAASNSWSMFHQDIAPDPTVGLGPAGPELVARCNELGLILDLTHTNRQGILDVCRLSDSPVIASHGGSRAVNRTDRFAPRVLDEESILAIASSGGCIGVPFCPAFLVGHQEASLAAVAADLARIRDTVDRGNVHRRDGTPVRGQECLCLGTDFDGWIPSIPDELEGAEDLPLLTQLLLDQRWDAASIAAMYGDNFIRVWTETTRHATAAPSNGRLPME